ncbi:pentatricopeptide repeat-containing protein At2g13600-like [Carica papaya]|uniref:pentatricopeptide repeat-containing protein At2g13600-like n=1 Tax=Carica papaya TaxID=3649 RepID=UPI000B8CB563|nr:pentatricopeptide repeat-containing protein At2g13600-like [Carica papaya]
MSCKDKYLLAKLQSHLLKTGLLFSSFNFHTQLLFSSTRCVERNSLEPLNNYYKSLNTPNPLSFNVILSDFSRNGFALPALKTFSFMHTHGVHIDTYALCSSLTASSSVKDLIFGEQTHTHVIKSGWLSSVFVGSSLVDLYSKLLFIRAAALVFDEIPVKNTVCANALLSGYCDAKLWAEGFQLVRQMPLLSLAYDHFTLSAMLRACAGLPAIGMGKQVHAYLFRKDYNMENDVFLRSSLIEMYGKCGLVFQAWRVFSWAGIKQEEIRKRDIVLWTSMLGVYGRNGQFKEVIELFKVMLMEGIKPDKVAFLTVISACGHTGQSKLGIEYFESMRHEYNLDPGPEHCSCIIDLFCRADELDKAWKLICEMEKWDCGRSISMWGTLLRKSEDSGNLEMGRFAAQKALELDPNNGGIYIMLSNLYAKFGMWEDISQLRELMKEKKLEKNVGCSWIEVTNLTQK